MLTTQKIVGKKEQLVGQLNYCNPNTAPLWLNLFKLGRVAKISATKASWVDYSCRGTQTKISADIAAAATSITVEDKNVFAVGALAAIGDEVVKVTAIDATTGALTVTRGQHSTTAAAHKLGDEIFYINDNIAEGADLQGSNYKAGVNYDNVTQIFREEIEVSGTAQATTLPSADGVDPYDLEITKGLDTVLGKMEKAIISGVKFESGGNRGLGGVKHFLSNGQNVDASAGALSYELLAELARKAVSAGGNLAVGNYAFYVSPVQSVKLAVILKDYVKVTPGQTTLGAVVSTIATPFGEVPVIVSGNLPADEILLLNHDELEIEELRPVEHQYMGATGDSIKGLIVGEATLKVTKIQTQGRIFNLKK